MEKTYERDFNSVPTMMTISQVSEKTGLSYYSLRHGCLNGSIVHIRIGNKFYINFDLLLERMNGKG